MLSFPDRSVQDYAVRMAIYLPLLTLFAWFLYLIKPAIVANGLEYNHCRWTARNRGLLAFMKASLDVGLHSTRLFAAVHRNILGSKDTDIHLVPIPHASTGFILMINKQLLSEYVAQPECDISLKQYTRMALVPDYTTLGAHIVIHSVYRAIVHRELHQKLSDKIEMMNEEIVAAIHELITSRVDSNGTISINMWETNKALLGRSATRIISGYPLCRNEEYLNATSQYAASFFVSAAYARFVPPFLRPLLLPILCRPLQGNIHVAAKHATPIITERLALIDSARAEGIEPDLPRDLLSAIILAAVKEEDPAERQPLTIVARMLVLNFVQSYTNLVTMTNLVHDLVSLPEPDFSALQSDLRAEIEAALAEYGTFSEDFCKKLRVMDSLIRESMRYNPIGETGLERTVSRPGGFTFSNGTHVPQGSIIAAPIKAYQRDEAVFPGGFDPRRSLRDPANPQMTDISPDFLNFGLGRGACPGRFFSSNLLKLTLSHLLMEFDFCRLDSRPENVRKITLDEPCGPERILLRKRS